MSANPTFGATNRDLVRSDDMRDATRCNTSDVSGA